MTDHLADVPSSLALPNHDSFLDDNVLTINVKTWELYFDGSMCRKGFGVGQVLITPEGKSIPLSYQLNFLYTNNTAEYEALIVGLQVALTMGAKDIKIFGNSQLVIKQKHGVYQTKNGKLSKYKDLTIQLLEKFESFTIGNIPQKYNQDVDALSQV